MCKSIEVIGFGIGTTELLIILAIFVFIFGASRLPELGRSLGSGIRGFQKAIKGDDEKKQLEQEGSKQLNSEQGKDTSNRQETGGDGSSPGSSG